MTTRSLKSAALLLLLMGCGPKTPPSAAAGIVVKAAEGGVVGEGPGAQLTVPAGALSKDASIKVAIQPPDTHADPGLKAIGPVWSFQVDGAEHHRFSKPVRIALPVDPALRTSGSAVGISVWTGDRWQSVPGAHLDTASGKAVADVDHFSLYVPHQDPSPHQVQRADEDRGKSLLNNKYWYGRVEVMIHGSGTRITNESTRQDFTIRRESVVTFRMKAMAGEVATISALEEMKKKGFALPGEMAKGMKELENRRHWVTELSKPEKEDWTEVHILIQDRSSSSSPKEELGELREEATWSKQSLKGGMDTQLPKCANQLEIDVEKGTYSFQLGAIGGGEVEYHASGDDGQKAADSLTRVDSKAPTGVDVKLKDLKLPEDKKYLSGTKRIPRSRIHEHIRGILGNWHFTFGHAKGLVRWRFSPEPFDDAELVLAPKDYKDWLPRGGKTEGEKGDTPLEIRARLQGRNGAPTKAKMTTLMVRLKDVSQEPGVCLNVPKDKGAGTPDFDLKFAPGNGYEVQDKGTKIVKKGSEFDKVDLTLDCYDWGAWGTIEGQATLDDGRIVFATLADDPAEDEVRVPKRDPESKIGDKWKTEMKVDGGQDLDDNDRQKGNSKDGDGLTMYEEYRGMFAKGKHTRDHPVGQDKAKPLTPLKKDLIVHNTIQGNAAVRKGLDLFENASGIHVVEVDDGELSDSRQVNVNRGTITVTAQYGLRLVEDSVKNAAGQAEGKVAARFEPDPTVSPKGFNRVVLNLALMKTDYEHLLAVGKGEGTKVPFTFDEYIATTTAHELAHGLGVAHHGLVEDARAYLTVTEQMKDWTIYDRRGKAIPDRPFEIGTSVGVPGNASSGDVRCIMCYNTIFNWSYHDPTRTFYAVPIIARGTLFCTSGNAWGGNLPYVLPNKKKSPGLFGETKKGNCLGQMQVKDP